MGNWSESSGLAGLRTRMHRCLIKIAAKNKERHSRSQKIGFSSLINSIQHEFKKAKQIHENIFFGKNRTNIIISSLVRRQSSLMMNMIALGWSVLKHDVHVSS